MTKAKDQYRASALLALLEGTKRGRAFTASCDLGRRYSAALELSTKYERRAIEWWFADNLDLKMPSMVEVFKWWPDDATVPKTTTLVVEGGKGTGKTTAAVGLLLRRGGEFVRAGALQEIPLGDKGEGQLERFQTAPLLVLDNLGTEKDIGPTLERVHAIMIWRDGAKLPTVITTTLVRDYRRDGRPIDGVPREMSFAGRYQDDVADRVRGDGTWARLGGQSMRGAQPDLRSAAKSLRRWKALLQVIEVKRGAGDLEAVTAVAAAAGFSEGDLDVRAREMEAEMRRALGSLPAELRGMELFARYSDRFGGPVASAES